MNMEQWSKEESLLVLDLYLSKPVGMTGRSCWGVHLTPFAGG